MRVIVEPMLSFEISAIDIVLLIAVINLLILYISMRKGHSANDSRAQLQNGTEVMEEPEAIDETIKGKRSSASSSAGFQRCVHHFGYLRNLQPNTPVPEECFGCPNTMRCLFPKEQNRLAQMSKPPS